MFELKKGKTQYVPVILNNVGGDGQAGVSYTDVTASLLLGGINIVNIGISASMWFEASGSNFSSTGVYSLLLHSASLMTTGSFMYAVGAGPNVPAIKYVGALKIVDVEPTEIFNLGVANSGTLDRLRKVSEGRWKIDRVTNKITFYELSDPTVPFLVMGLTGSDGAPTADNPFERRPTS